MPVDWVARNKTTKLVVYRDCVDRGPATKLVGAAAIIAVNPTALVIYLDDDHIPSAFFVKTHVDAHRAAKVPTVFCGRGEWLKVDPTFRRGIVETTAPPTTVQIASGVGSVSVLAKHLDAAALDAHVAALPRYTLFADDLLFSSWFEQRGLKIRTLGTRYLLQMMDHSVDDSALHKAKRQDCDTKTSERYATVTAALGLTFNPENAEPPRPLARSRVPFERTAQCTPGPPAPFGGTRPCALRPSRVALRGLRSRAPRGGSAPSA